MADSQTRATIAQNRYEALTSKYGGTENQWRGAGAATLIGADIAEGYSQWATESLRAASMDRRREELGSRADQALASIAQQGSEVRAAQTVAYAKSGVKMEGSALNVLSETMNSQMEAQQVKQREASYMQSQLAVEEALTRTKAKYAKYDTAFKVANSAVTAYTDV